MWERDVILFLFLLYVQEEKNKKRKLDQAEYDRWYFFLSFWSLASINYQFSISIYASVELLVVFKAWSDIF